MTSLPLSLRIARRELRGSLRSFRVFLACLALGVAAMAGVGSVSSSMLDGVARDARVLLGGDVELRITHTQIEPEARAFIERDGRISESIEMRAMARKIADGVERTDRALVELKAVDGLYPLYGAIQVEGGGDVQDLLAERDGRPGALIDAALAARLALAVGDRVEVGDLEVEVRGVIAKEPDRVTSFATFGPRLMISRSVADRTGLIVTGSLIRYYYRVALADGVDRVAWLERLREAFPNAPWRLRSLDEASPGLDRFIDRVTQFLTIVGLTALLVGGVGIANAVKAFLDRRLATIATLKCLGASSGLVFRVYLVQVLLLASLGIAAGLVVGAIAPLVAGRVLERLVPFDIPVAIYWQPLLASAAFGYLTTLAFSLWPLGRAKAVKATQLFRALIAPPTGAPARAYVIATAAASLVLAALAIVTAQDKMLATWFVVGAVGVFALFSAAATLIMKAAKRLPSPRRPDLRLAVSNLHRPGAPTPSVLLSLGLGLTVLVVISLIEANLSRQITERIPERAPAFFFIDIQPHQVVPFGETVHAVKGVERMESTPMVRGRITRVNGVPTEEVIDSVNPDVRWTLNGDRGLTFSATPPRGTEVVAGEWWPEDYSGPPIISFGAEIAKGYGIGVGDTLTVNVLGREITATIANLREIDWASLGINFAIVFAPGTLEAAPHSVISTVYTDGPEAEHAVERAVIDRFPNISAIRVKEALDGASAILSSISVAVRVTATVTLLAGLMVLAGAMTAGQDRRIYDAVVLKVLGATRRRVLSAYVMEYGLLGGIAAAVGALVGTVVAWAIVSHVMRADFAFEPVVVFGTVAVGVVATIGLGLAGTWGALGRKAAPMLRNE